MYNPSTLYATGLTNVFDKFPNRSIDPGMEEQHAMSMTVGIATEVLPYSSISIYFPTKSV